MPISPTGSDEEQLLQEDKGLHHREELSNRSLKEIKISLKYKARKIKTQKRQIEALNQIMCLYLIPVNKEALLHRPQMLRESFFGCFVNLSVEHLSKTTEKTYIPTLEYLNTLLDKLATILKLEPTIKYALFKPIKSRQRQVSYPHETLHDTIIDPFVRDLQNYSESIKDDMYKIFEHNFNEFFGYPVVEEPEHKEAYANFETNFDQNNISFFSDEVPDLFPTVYPQHSTSSEPSQETLGNIDYSYENTDNIQQDNLSTSNSDTSKQLYINQQEANLQDITHISPAEAFKPIFMEAFDHNLINESERVARDENAIAVENISQDTTQSITDNSLFASKYHRFDHKLTCIIEHNKIILVDLLKQFESIKSLIIESEDVDGCLVNWGAEYTRLNPINIILSEFVHLILSNDWLDSRIHTLLEHFFLSLNSSNEMLLLMEDRFETSLFSSLIKSKTKRNRKAKNLKVAAFAIGGGIFLALTTAIAAPGIIAGLTAIGLGGGLSFFTTTGGVALAASLFGASGGGLAGWKYSKRVADIKTFEFDKLSYKSSKSLRIIVCVSGCIRTMNDLVDPWVDAFNPNFYDLYSLRWEPDLLGKIVEIIGLDMSKNIAIQVSQFGLKFTAAGAIAGAAALPFSIFVYAASLDNIWLTLKERAKQAGELLAEAITSKKVIGKRPVNLVGYSIGARVIFYCLMELNKKKKIHYVKNAVLIGLPTSLNKSNWKKAREVVSGRLINVYNESDWLIAFLYRYLEWGFKVAALSPVLGVNGVENYEVSGLVKSHFDYNNKLNDIFDYIKLTM